MFIPLLRYSCLIIDWAHAQDGEHIQTEATAEHVNPFLENDNVL